MRWLAIGLGSALGLVALALGSLYALAQTEGGRAWLIGYLESSLSTPGAFELDIGRLDGPLPHSLRLSELRISDGDGAWLEAAAIRIDWRPLALLGRTLWIETVEVEDLRVARRPVPPPGEDAEPADLTLPSLPGRIVVERLAVNQVILDEPALGAPASFQVLGEASTPTSDDLHASLLLERSDGTAGRVDLQGDYRISDKTLKLALSIDEPAGGLIARALQLPDLPAVAARFDGDGPISAWRGHLALQLAGLASAEADVELSGERDLVFKLTGSGEASRTLTEMPWLLLAGRTSFQVMGRWDDPARLAIEQAQLENTAARLTLSGTLDLGTLEADARAEGSLSDGRLLAALVAGAESDRLALKARLTGTLEAGELSLEASTTRLRIAGAEARAAAVKILARRPLLVPELQVEIEAGTLSAPPFVAEGLTSRGLFRPDRPLDRGALAGPIEITGGARRLLVEGEPILQSLVGEEALGWDLMGRLDLGRDTLSAEPLKLSSEHLTLTARGELDLARGAAETEVEATLAELAGFGALLGFDLSGRAEASATIRVQDFGERLEAKASGVVSALELEDAVAQALLTDQATIAAEIRLEPQGGLAVEGLTVQSRHARLSGTAALNNDFEELEADYRLAIDDIGVLGTALGQDLSGGAQAEGRAVGRIGNPRLSGTVALEKPRVEGFGLARLQVDYSAEDPAGNPRGRLSAQAVTPVGDLSGQADFRLDGPVLQVSKLNLETGQSRASGSAAVPLNSGPVTARITVQSGDLAPWLGLAGTAGGGSGTAELTLSADGARQAGLLSTKLQDLSLRLQDGRELRAGGLAARLESGDLRGEIGGTVSLAAEDVAADDLNLDTLSVDGSGKLAAADYRVAMAGRWFGPLTLNAAGHLAWSEQRVAVDIARLEGQVLGERLTSRQGFRITQAPGVLELGDADLAYGDGRVRASAQLGPDRLAIDLAATDLSLARLDPLWPTNGITGLVTADLEVSGSPSKPSGRMTLSVTDLKTDAVSQAPPGQLALSGDWRNERVDLEGSIKGLAKKDVVFSLALPLRLDPATLTPGIPQEESIAGHVTWQGNIAELWPLVPITGHEFEGLGEAELTLGGSLASPRLGGSLTLDDGAYESLATGTLLRDLDLELQLEGQRVVLTQLTASDGASGSLSASGELDLDPERDFPMRLSWSIEKLTLVRLDDVTAAANGEISLAGSLHAALLGGSLETAGVEIRIPDRLPPQVVELEVIEAGKEGGQPPPDSSTATAEQAFRLALDLAVEMPKRVFLRGRGLDSEWAGKLAVTGTAEQPVIKGKLALVRGQISAIGQTFKLEKGSIDFLGGEKIDPLVDVTAVRQSKDLKVTVRVHGPATNPTIALSSTPELPQDEIVSRLLFGRSTTQLSALEAVQLAAAVAELSGAGGSRNVLDLARGKLGIDVLRVGSVNDGDATATAVSAGKYLRDDVYVGVTQATTPESSAVEVEVELTPNISIESKVGQTGESKLGIRFKWDY